MVNFGTFLFHVGFVKKTLFS